MKLRRILALLLSFMLIVGAVPTAMAAEEADVSLVVAANKTEVNVGDTVTFSYYLYGANNTDGVKNYKFDVSLGAGLEYVSYSIPSGASDIFAGTGFDENAMRTLSTGTVAEEPYKGSSIKLLSITCTVVGETGLTASASTASFIDANYKRLNTEILDEDATLSVHNHTADEWSHDDEYHWHMCECGEKFDNAKHTFEETDSWEGTCEEQGGILWTCDVCGYSYTEKTGLGSCVDEDGDGVCDNCGDELCDHDRVIDEAVEATCEMDGLTEGEHCSICGKVFKEQEVIPALGHNWTEANCTEAKHCERCGETEGEALGHDAEAATCTEDSVCKRCGHVLAEAYGHEWEIKAETETEIIWQCIHCGATMSEELDPNTTVEVRPDGTIIITTYHEDGTKTVEIRKDGVIVIMLIDEKDNVLTVEVTISGRAASEAEKAGEALVLPMDIYKLLANGAVDVTFTVHTDKAVPVEIAVANVNPGCVVVIVNADGTETVVANTKMTENGLVFNCADGMTVKVVNRAMSFSDVKSNAWYGDAVAFVTARGIMNGMGNNSFGPTATTTRVQVWAMLARLSGVDAYGADWATIAREWAMEKGITDGERANDNITRQELVTMLYRFVGEKGETKSVSSFSDAGKISSWAKAAMEWAYAEGVMNGNADGTLNPTGNTTRAEMAQFFMNFIQNI